MQILKRLFLLLTPYWETLILSALLLVGRAGLELVPLKAISYGQDGMDTAALPDLIISARPENSGRLAGLLAALPGVLLPAGSGPRLNLSPVDEASLKQAGWPGEKPAAGR